MRIECIELYQFEELDDVAKERARAWWRGFDTDYTWSAENRQSLEAFEKVFPIKITRWEYGGRGEGVSFYFTTDYVENVSGQRLATYIWNNYRSEIYEQKYRKSWSTDHKVKHRKVTSKWNEPTKHNPEGYWWNVYHGGPKLEGRNGLLTGYCMDDSLLGPVYDFLDKPDANTDFRDLMERCFHEWIKDCNADIEWQNSDEYIDETLVANEYEFTKTGRRHQ